MKMIADRHRHAAYRN